MKRKKIHGGALLFIALACVFYIFQWLTTAILLGVVGFILEIIGWILAINSESIESKNSTNSDK